VHKTKIKYLVLSLKVNFCIMIKPFLLEHW